jgi:PKD repeat protein
MRKIFTLIIILFSVASFGQIFDPNFVDGKLYFKVQSWKNPKTGTISLPLKSNKSNELPVQIENPEKYGITSVDYAFGFSKSEDLNRIYAVKFTNIAATNELIAALKQSPQVAYVERVPRDKKVLDPNDPRFIEQWHLNRIAAPAAWNYFSTGSTVAIAIVDDAIDRNHPDLAPNIWVNPNEIPGNGIDDDANGYIDDVNGWDVALNNNNPNPPSNQYDHGTHVAGIASAATNNGIGVASIGFSCKIMCVKATDDPNSITHGYAGLRYAVDAGAKIINLSWGSSSFSSSNEAAIAYAISQGAIVVAAAGNENTSTIFYPAGYSGVVSVASTTFNDAKSSFSNYGSWVRISAPGSQILSTIPGNGYDYSSGTSMASPMVAGLLGLMKSRNPGAPNTTLLNCLYSTADDISSQNQSFDGQLGAGRINAQRAMECILGSLNNPPIADFSGTPLTIQAGGRVRFTDRSSFLPTSWSWTFTGGSPATSTAQQPVDIQYNTPGVYPVTLTVSNANGSNTITKTNYITVTEPSTCLRVNLPLPNNWTTVNYIAGSNVSTSGYVNGTNRFNDRQKAMFFNLNSSTTANHKLTSFWIAFGVASSPNPDRKVYFRVFDGTGSLPGAQLAVDSLTMGEIIEQVEDNEYTIIDMGRDINLPASRRIFISVDMSELKFDEGDVLSILSNTLGQSNTNDIFEMTADGQWLRYGTPGSWGLVQASLLIHPHLTNTLTTPVVSPKTATICSGNTIELNGNSSTAIAGKPFQWILPGASPTLIINNQIAVNPTYNTPGAFKAYLFMLGACDELRVDSGLVTVNPTPPLSIVATKNPICAGETTQLTATGGTSFTWTPGTALSATTGSVVQANPLLSTSYTVTTTNGLCSKSIIYEVVVRSRSAGVTIAANPATITTPTNVTFTATPNNGGSNPTYNFLVNNVSRQNGASAVFTALVSPNDRVVCRMTSNEPCVDEKTVTSNELIMGNSSLPVTLFQFAGRKTTEGNLLNWITASEANSALFIVEHSTDGANFKPVGEVAAAGNSSTQRAYQYLHRSPAGQKHWYRLKLVDTDGTFAYSPIVVIAGEQGALITKLYPNPTPRGTQALLQLGNAANGRVSISVVNAAGQVVHTINAFATGATVSLVMPADKLVAGQYAVVCRNQKGEVVETLKWTIMP